MTDLKLTRREQARTRTQNSSKTVKDSQDKGKKVKRFYGDEAYDADEVYETGLRSSSRLGRTLLLCVAIPLGGRL
jgi:hypothetical protein